MSLRISLPDDSSKLLDDGSTALDLAKSISPKLARDAVLSVVNDTPRDLTHPLADGDRVRILTSKDALALETLRHSAAHLMAAAILAECPRAQLTIGPTTDDGFFYDIFLPEGTSLSEDDFPRIEAQMQALVSADQPFRRCVADDEDSPVFRDYMLIDGGHNPFKREIIDDLKRHGALSGQAGTPELSFYRMGSFLDLCRGPHVPSTRWLAHTKLMKIAGSYWRADATRERLVRVYGTAFFSKAELEQYLHMLEEAKKRDHRVLGEKLDLFHFIDEAPGFPFLHPKGATVYNGLVDFMRAQLRRRDYVEVRTPIILPETTWHTSGHYEHYMENMFFTKRKMRDEKNPNTILEDAGEDRPMAVKPMNCPGHLMIYRHRLRSYTELPLRIAEMGLVHRRELSGVRHGMFRVQAFVQDDAHHFCTPDQIEPEIAMLIAFFFEVYGAFDLRDVRLELSTRPAKSIGSDEMWNRAEAALRSALDRSGRTYVVNPGDGAFYGPKIDFHIRDVLGRSWQCGTIQLDFSMPVRFGIEYVGSDGQRHTPVMVHRACFGSLERFFGIITENYAGAFPTWLAPVQVSVLSVSEKWNAYARQLASNLKAAGFRVELDETSERLGYKIRGATTQKIPYVLVVGQKEAENGTLNVRCRDGEDWGELDLGAFLERVGPLDAAALVKNLALANPTSASSPPAS